MANVVICHGAWGGGWSWRRMRPLLRAHGHEVFTPTLTGLGERAHLAGPSVDLDTHVQDIVNVLEFEDLKDVVLIGHSYGGMVITGVAARVPERLKQLIYLDAMVPKDGQCLLDLVSPADREARLKAAAASEGGWRLPPNPPSPDTAAADVAFMATRRVDQPIDTFAKPVRLGGKPITIPRAYIYAELSGPGDVFRQFYDRAGSETGWSRHTIAASHSPNATAPELLAELLEKIIKGG